MSDIMRPIPFGELMDWVLTEYAVRGSIFGVTDIYRHTSGKKLPIFTEQIETPFGSAAGPHTQLAQNLIAAYAGGSRFFEVKTVQIIDGEDPPVSKPCIRAEDECYNVEWSTELRVPQAFDEYVKAWFAIKLLSRQLGLGDENGFVFNMSVGYDLAGIQSPKVDAYIEGMKDASTSAVWAECTQWAKENLSRLDKIDAAYIDAINPHICTSITLSTLHGCPPDEIERIATYLIDVKKLNTYIKCNPTLLGYEFARKTLDDMGYDYIVFDDHHFKDDLQFSDAVPMFHRLLELAAKNSVEFGVKLTNTFPVTIAGGELPGEEMYMSGKSLYPLSISLALKVEKEFAGKLREALQTAGGLDTLEGQSFYGEYSGITDPMGSDKPNPVSHVAYGYAAQVVIMDENKKVTRVVAAYDVGRVVNPQSCAGQIEGGVVMGLGYGLTEDFKMENGYVKSKYGTLGLLRPTDVPPIDVIFVEKGTDDQNTFGAKGVGEISAIPAAPACANAAYRVDGVLRTSLPIQATFYRKAAKK